VPDTRLVLVRHGQSEATVQQVVGGHGGCTGLSPLGRRQAEALRDRLTRTGLLRDATALLASVLPRAIETAEIIAPAVGHGRLDVVQDCDLCEVHPGEGDGLTWTDFVARYGEPHWDADPGVPLSPGGESLVVFRERVSAALRRLAGAYPGQLVVIACHGGVIMESMFALGGVRPDGRPARFEPANTGLTMWSRDEAVGDRWRLDRYNDTGHTDGWHDG
jgi:probable phosphoglycerate mutase